MTAHSEQTTDGTANGQMDRPQAPKQAEGRDADWLSDPFDGPATTRDRQQDGKKIRIGDSAVSTGAGDRTPGPDRLPMTAPTTPVSRTPGSRSDRAVSDAAAAIDVEVQTGDDSAADNREPLDGRTATGPSRTRRGPTATTQDGQSEAEQWKVVGPDDRGIMEEFGGVDDTNDAEQEIFDWFALEIEDPLDAGNDVFGEAEALPGLLADMQEVRLGREQEVGTEAGRRSDPELRQSIIARPDTNHAPEFGNRSDQPDSEERISGLQEDAGPNTDDPVAADADMQSAPNPAGPRKVKRRVRHNRSSASRNLPRGLGGLVRGVAVFCLAAMLGIAALHAAMVGGLGDRLLKAIAVYSGAESNGRQTTGTAAEADVPASDKITISTEPDNRAPIQSAAAGDDGPVWVSVDNELEAGSKPVAGTFRLTLEPVGLEAGVPVRIDASDMSDWNRLMELLNETARLTGQSEPSPEHNASSSIDLPSDLGSGGRNESSPSNPSAPDSSGKVGLATGGNHPRDYTADDGFAQFADIAGSNEAAEETQARSSNIAIEAVTAGNSSALEVLPVNGHSGHGGAAALPAEPQNATDATGLPQRLLQIERRLSAMEKEIIRIGVRNVVTGSSPFPTPPRLSFGRASETSGSRRETTATANRRAYVMKGGTGGLPFSGVLEDIRIGDRIEGFGVVVDLSEYQEGGRLLVMENGTIFQR